MLVQNDARLEKAVSAEGGEFLWAHRESQFDKCMLMMICVTTSLDPIVVQNTTLHKSNVESWTFQCTYADNWLSVK